MPPLIDPATPPMDLLPRFGPGSVHAPVPLDDAMAYVRGLAGSHYENFHVLSSLVPRDLRDDFAAVYAFCRWADDLGDETGKDDDARARSLELLGWWRAELQGCFGWATRRGADLAGPQPARADHSPPQPLEPGGPRHPVFVALAETIRRHGCGARAALTITPFDRLIQAFELDQTLRHTQTWDQLLHYCTLSADPVGRIVLALAGYAETPENAELYAMSDATCTALQLTNHWQDVRRDLLEKDRVYVPSVDTGVTPQTLRDWAARVDDPEARVPYIKMMRGLVERTRLIFEAGRGLPARLDRRIGPVVWLFGAGGRAVLRSIERGGCTTLWKRPTLTPSVKAWLLARAWITTRLPGTTASHRPSSSRQPNPAGGPSRST